MNSISANAIDRFLFAPVDARVAAGFRLAFAVALAVMFWPEGRTLGGFLANFAVAQELWSGVFLTPLWWGIALAAISAWGLGLGGRPVGFLVVVLLLPLGLLSGAYVSRHLLLFSLFAFSLLRSGRGRQSAGPMWPLRLIQFQLSLAYFVNALAKCTPEYLSGDALVAMSQRLPHFLVDLSGGVFEFGPLAIPVWLCAIGTVVTEFALGLLWWVPRFRVATAVLGFCFHMSLKWVIEIGWLDWACIFLYLSFLLPFEGRVQVEPEAFDPPETAR